ncbi:MAG: hypothetical protein GY807_23460 [Gammaproteobacteria bacterium]|nr:hypothetical protein [Gammaproteobacteria bacterium]
MMLNQAAPEGFYIVSQEEIWEGLIDPEIMTPAQLDAAIVAGIEFYKKMHPPSSWIQRHMGLIIIVGIAAAAVVAVGAVGASGAGAAAGTTTATTTATATTTGGWSTISSAKAVAMAQKGATYLKKAKAPLIKAIGNNDATRLINAADAIANSPDVTTAATTIVKSELAAEGARIQTKAAEDALKIRIQKEQEMYSEYMRRQGYELEEQITGGIAPAVLPTPRPNADLATIAMAATPFILMMLGRN